MASYEYNYTEKLNSIDRGLREMKRSVLDLIAGCRYFDDEHIEGIFEDIVEIHQQSEKIWNDAIAISEAGKFEAFQVEKLREELKLKND